MGWIREPSNSKPFLSTTKVEVKERNLNTRKQRIGESEEDYVYEMVDICYAVDELMPEAQILEESEYARPKNDT